MFCKAVVGSVAALILMAGPSLASDRYLVFKMNHKTNVLPKRSHEVWSQKPIVGTNIPDDAIVIKMPDEPKGAQPGDFLRTSNGLVYDPE